jgi:hypothetical protein
MSAAKDALASPSVAPPDSRKAIVLRMPPNPKQITDESRILMIQSVPGVAFAPQGERKISEKAYKANWRVCRHRCLSPQAAKENWPVGHGLAQIGLMRYAHIRIT